jgi:hypothetical protein
MDYVVPLGEDPLLDAALEAANTFLEGEYTSDVSHLFKYKPLF